MKFYKNNIKINKIILQNKKKKVLNNYQNK